MIQGTQEPQWDEGPHQASLENAVKNANVSMIEQCAMVAQMWKAGPLFEDADPRVIALIKQEISDEIRRLAR